MLPGRFISLGWLGVGMAGGGISRGFGDRGLTGGNLIANELG